MIFFVYFTCCLCLAFRSIALAFYTHRDSKIGHWLRRHLHLCSWLHRACACTAPAPLAKERFYALLQVSAAPTSAPAANLKRRHCHWPTFESLCVYGSRKFRNSLLFLVYLIVAFPLLSPVASSIKQDLFIKIGVAAFLIGLTSYSLYRQKRRGAEKFSLRKTIPWIVFLAISPVLIGINAIENLSTEKPVLKVCLTGKIQMREIVWKNPAGPLRCSPIECHEIVFQRIDGKEIARFLLSGDLIGVRAKILRFHPFLNAIGIPNKFQPDIVYSGYRRAEDYSQFPVEAHPLVVPTSFFHSLLLGWWDALFFHHSDAFWFKSANLESNYFPMVDKSGQVLEAEYFLTLSSAGLSAIKT
jgi:hypothetical protein